MSGVSTSPSRCAATSARRRSTAFAAGPDAPGWDSFDATLLRLADELHAKGNATDTTWATLAERYSTEQLMDAVFAVGQYTLVSYALNAFGVEREPGVVGLPSPPT